jgi:hypothetical protein
MYHPYQSGSDKDGIFEMFNPSFQNVLPRSNWNDQQGIHQQGMNSRQGISRQGMNSQQGISQQVREYFEGGHRYQLTSDGRFGHPMNNPINNIEGFRHMGQLGHQPRHGHHQGHYKHITKKKPSQTPCSAALKKYCKNSCPQGKYCQPLCGCGPTGPTPPPPPTGPTPVPTTPPPTTPPPTTPPPTGPTPVPTPAGKPTPAPSLPPVGTPFFGYWYSYYCTIGSYSPNCCSGNNNTCNEGGHTPPGEDQEGLLPLEDMAHIAFPDEFKKHKINTTAQLGVGAPPSAHNYSWNDLLCHKSDTVLKAKAKYNIMNIGGWGPGKEPYLWDKSIDIPNDKEIDTICQFLGKNGFQGISFDIEGLTRDWHNTDDNKDGNVLLSEACGKIQKKGYMAWIVIPAFNVKPDFGGPLNLNKPSFKDNITLVQLMCYGQGLDSEWAGDPNGTPLTSTAVINTITAFNKTIPANKIMTAWSFPTEALGKGATKFQNIWKDVSQYAQAGLFAWCKGNSQIFSYHVKDYGSCSSSGPGPTTPTPPPFNCSSATSQDECNKHPGQCLWGTQYSPGAPGNCRCYSTTGGATACGPTPPTPPPAPSPPPAPTPPTPSGGNCHAIPGTAANDPWCNSNCNATPPYCPKDLCQCD